MKHRNAVMPPVQYKGDPLPVIFGDGVISLSAAADFFAAKVGLYMPARVCLEAYGDLRDRAVNQSSVILYARLEPWGA